MMRENRVNIKRLTLSAMFMALGIVLPFFTGQIPQVGNMLLPMHIPILLCGLICGGRYGLAVGFITPLLRSALFGRPEFYPSGIAMAFELATYGAVIGFLYGHSRWKCVIALYRCMIAAMLAGRAVWGAAEIVLLGLKGNAFTWQAFMAGAFLNAIPGIILQLFLIPAIMIALNRTGLVPFSHPSASANAADT
ncbi:MAG: ECF transporter S component [Oscillospiraceae bacterium]|nr:ECF transporter S component [Oscillospiraceae bacterium]MCC8156719.1 ECF transporter S component [Oscillospiraceae bacterium]MCD8128269.1 ECF transporter S component [Oscillospiraceae bacterium]MCD8256593.1 ECF transporter S component [Oscillospiraceae bacterium]